MGVMVFFSMHKYLSSISSFVFKILNPSLIIWEEETIYINEFSVRVFPSEVLFYLSIPCVYSAPLTGTGEGSWEQILVHNLD